MTHEYINQKGEPVDISEEPQEKKDSLVDRVGVAIFATLFGAVILIVISFVFMFLVGALARVYNWMMGAWL